MIIDDVAKHPGSTASDVRKRTGKPWTTIDRQLKALHMLEVLDCAEVPYGANEEKHRWLYSLSEGINPDALNPDSIPKPSRELATPPVSQSSPDSASPRIGVAATIGLAALVPPDPVETSARVESPLMPMCGRFGSSRKRTNRSWGSACAGPRLHPNGVLRLPPESLMMAESPLKGAP